MSAKSNKIVKLGESQNATQAVDKSRRSFARLGVAAPVIMTLASKPVFAVQGLSHMQSIAPSNGGHCFSGGRSHGYFKNISKWTELPSEFTAEKSGNGTNATYTGTTISQAFLGNGFPIAYQNYVIIGLLHSEGANGYYANIPISDIYVLEALLNCKLLGSGYFMTEAQIWAMYKGTMAVPLPYTSLQNLIEFNQDKDLNCTGVA